MRKEPCYFEAEIKVKALDKCSMLELDNCAYREIVNTELFELDTKHILCDGITGHPVAATIEQLDILIEELQKMRSEMFSSSCSSGV